MPLERPHAILVHPVAQELHGGGGKHALCRVDLQAVLLKDGEDLPEMLHVLLQAVAGDDDVVQVAEDEGQVLEDAVHEALEGLGCVAEAEGHEEVLEQTKWRNDRRLGDVLGRHRYLMVALHQVDAGEEFAAVQLVGEVEYAGERVAVVCRSQVQPAVVAAGPPCPVFLAYHVQW